jgi:hypothetical protein
MVTVVESTRFVPAGAMAHEFILGELAEFVGFVGEPGTGRAVYTCIQF